MTKNVSKKLRKIGNQETAKAKNATVAKTEKSAEQKVRVNQFGVTGVRPNRADKSKKSEMGDRKWIFRAVLKVNAGGVIDRANTAPALESGMEPVLFDTTEAAHKAAEAARSKNPAIINARVFPRAGKRVLWVAFTEDNGKLVTA